MYSAGRDGYMTADGLAGWPAKPFKAKTSPLALHRTLMGSLHMQAFRDMPSGLPRYLASTANGFSAPLISHTKTFWFTCRNVE